MRPYRRPPSLLAAVVLLCGLFLIAALLRASVPSASQSRIQRLVATWVTEGSAAGNAGDVYDNRDNGHSLLQVGDFPGMVRIEYPPDEVEIRGYGWQPTVLPHVTLGNSSTASRIEHGGNARTCYTDPSLLRTLYQQYRGNNLYIYPEHQDHDPGHNGTRGGGYGDLLPLNSPYLICTQGSSGSDKPFLRAVAHMLAAFRPDVKKRLVETGLLMPTIQAILRMSGRNVADHRQYLTGKAHPSVFDGRNLDVVKMIETAHAMSLAEIPPLVQLRVVEEDVPEQGRDYFEAVRRSEQIADTPCVVARVFRGHQMQRRLVVSAADSFDLLSRPLKFHWVVLRGDDARIEITPWGDGDATVEIRVLYHPRRRIRWSATMTSNRVDIGVFADNGVKYSAPAFITLYSLDSEVREYDDRGRIRQIDYTTGNFADPRLTDRKPWKDVYQYDGDTLVGWTRYHTGGLEEDFTADGRLVLKRDTIGQPVRAARVGYRYRPGTRDDGGILESYVPGRIGS